MIKIQGCNRNAYTPETKKEVIDFLKKPGVAVIAQIRINEDCEIYVKVVKSDFIFEFDNGIEDKHSLEELVLDFDIMCLQC